MVSGSVTRHRLAWIDAAKGIAILGIVAVHASQRVVDVPPLMLRAFGAGRYGVQIFFLVSGYAVAWSLFARRASGQGLSWGDFYVRRLARIAPVAYAGAVANVLINGAAVTALSVTVTALFLQGWDPTFSGLVFGGWVLTVEVAFYVLAPPVSRWVRSWRAAAVVAGSSIVIAIAINRVAALVVPISRQEEFLYFWPPTQLPFIALGILLFYLCPPDGTGLPTVLHRRRRLAVAGVLAIATVLTHSAGNLFLYLAVPAAGLVLAAEPPGRLLSNRLVTWLGRISYSVFIWHFFVLDALQRLLEGRLHGAAGLLGLYAIGLALSVVVGAASARLIEEPVARALAGSQARR